MSLVTVVTPLKTATDRCDRLTRTLTSVQSQVGVEWEHLLVGDTESVMVREYCAQSSGRARFISAPGSAPTEQINLGLSQARGEVVAWLAPGDVYYRDTLRVVSETFREQPAAGVVFGDAVLFDEDDRARGRFRTKSWEPRRIQSRCCLCQPAVFLRRSPLPAGDLLNTEFNYWSDYDLWLRLTDLGIKFVRTPQLLAGTEVPSETGTKHIGPFARDVSPAATAELNSLFQRRCGKVPTRWLVHAGRVASVHDSELPAESLPHFLSTLRYARAEAQRYGQSGWATPFAWAWLPVESVASEWRRLRRDPHPVKRLLPMERVARDAKSSLQRKREHLLSKRHELTERMISTPLGRLRGAGVRAWYASIDAWYRAVEAGKAGIERVMVPLRKQAAYCVAQSKRRIFKLKNYDPKPLTFPGSYARTRAPLTAPKISIVTPNLNQGPYLEATIRSVVDQGYPNVEYIVQDGCSKDESLDVIRRFEDRIAHWASEKDSGQTNAINRGMRHATGEIMAYLNSDDILLPGSLAYVARYFAKHPEVDVVYGHRVLIDENGSDIGRWVLPPHDNDILAFVDYVPQETMFWRRSIFEKVGGQLDEAFHFAMDWDLILRFREAGARFHRLPRFLGAFRISSDNKTTTLLETVGRRDMEILRKRVLGRIPDDREINRVIRPYLKRHWVFDKLYLTGVLRY
ncbi:MAG: glycosyltransferase [Planctomycetaceae bacterium]